MRDKKPHLLTKLKSTKMPSQMVFFDTESEEVKLNGKEVQHVLKLGWACYYRRRPDKKEDYEEWKYFEAGSLFWSWVESQLRPKAPLYLMSHNITFDFTVTSGFKYLIQNKWKITGFYNEYSATIIKFKKGPYSLIVLDSMNFFKCSLKRLGEQIGLAKTEVDFRTATKDQLSSYCKNDVLVLKTAFLDYIGYLKKNNLGRFGYTTPAQAMNAYRARFMTGYIQIHNYKKVIKLERRAYFGGRTECFRLGVLPASPIYCVDVNSMYPYQMKTQKFPTRADRWLIAPDEKTITKYLNDHLLIAYCMLKTDQPVFPYRADNKTLFPIGRFRAALTTPELKHAFEHHLIEKIYYATVYRSDNIFSQFVDFFHAQKTAAKKAGRGPDELFSKLMMNSLYGKFGQLATSWEQIGECDIEEVRVEDVKDGRTGKWHHWYFFGGNVWEVRKEGEAYHSFVAVCAHVTAYARMYLWELIQIAGKANVFYCDTDSLFVNEAGIERLSSKINPDKLGSLSIQKTAASVVLHGLKDYRFGDEVKLKGIRKNAVKISENVYQQERWSSFKGMMNRGSLDEFVVLTVTKNLSRKYNKGSVDEYGLICPVELIL